MKSLLPAIGVAAVVLALGEFVCRSWLHLSDSVVPLVVLPITIAALVSTRYLLARTGSDAHSRR